MEVNGVASGVLGEEVQELGGVLIHYSTDYVFDGKKGSPYTEDDHPKPLSTYGKTKLAGEDAISGVGGPHLILRTSWLYSLRSGHNFVAKVLYWAREQKIIRVVDDQICTPAWSRLIAEATAQIASQGARDPGEFFNAQMGIYHLVCAGHGSRYEWARAVLEEDPHRKE
jgi:dTDP-4-dehydrorhamnose reductase